MTFFDTVDCYNTYRLGGKGVAKNGAITAYLFMTGVYERRCVSIEMGKYKKTIVIALLFLDLVAMFFAGNMRVKNPTYWDYAWFISSPIFLAIFAYWWEKWHE